MENHRAHGRTLKFEIGEKESVIDCFESPGANPLVVHLKDVYFNYNKKDRLIKGLNLNIQQGHIYGLLGPSGCGKSTTLKIILGLLRPNSGKVTVFGTKPYTAQSTVPGIGSGYMPQDLALMPTMTVMDNFFYFGCLHGMRRRDIGKRSAYLLELLQIPAMNRPIQNLSGGQQRRTSLAMALLHSPPLLVLDEPTVGIDPLLRNKIWSYLQELTVRESKTIIITTHYIEESRNAHMIGLMRYGSLLAEANPDRLLLQFGMSTIEEVFLNLCEKEDLAMERNKNEDAGKNDKKKSWKGNSNKRIKVENSKAKQVVYAHHQMPKRGSFWFNTTRVTAIVKDTFTFMSSNMMTIFFACILPTIQLFFFHYSIGRPPQTLPISIYAPEKLNASRRITERFSDIFVNQFNPVVKLTYSESLADANNLVQNGSAIASFAFSSNFTRCLYNRARKGAEAPDYDIACSQVRMVSDNTYQFLIFQLALHLKEAFFGAIYQFFPKLGYNPESLNMPIKTEEFVYGQEEFSFQEFMTPGMYMSLIYLAPLIVTMFVLLEQKVNGFVQRSLACGAKSAEIIASHFIANVILLVLQCGFMMAVSILYFEAHNMGSLPLLVGIVFMQGIAGVSLAILLGSVVRDKLVAMVALYALTVSLWLVCGIFWPTQNITITWLQPVVSLLPLTLPTESARNVMNRGWGLEHIEVLLGFGSALAYSVIPLLFSLILFKRFSS